MSTKRPKNKATPPILAASDLMPKDKMATRILKERAIYMAISEPDKKKSEGYVAYIKFRLGPNEFYGIPYTYAKEVMQHTTPTKVPFVPKYIAGVINRRGALLSVYDLKQFFHTQNSATESKHIILLTCANLTVGFLADSIEGSDYYDPNTLDAALCSEDIKQSNYIVGLHQGVTAIINVEALLLGSLVK